VIEIKGATKFISFVLPSDKMRSFLSFLEFYFLLCDLCSVIILAAVSNVYHIWEDDDPSDMLFQQVEHPRIFTLHTGTFWADNFHRNALADAAL
jgi:predicted membrane channel-forming protein YqfA (hemolysin III family)